jgi:WD40 repeat protein
MYGQGGGGPSGRSQGGGGSEYSQGGGPQEEITDDLMELEHVVGYTGHFLDNVHFHPDEPNLYITTMGSSVVIGDMTDPHKQEFLRGHDEEITSLTVSPTGSMVASGQIGSTTIKTNDAPVLVWDFFERRELFQLAGHTQGILRLAFSPDERFLCATGQDSLLYIWDMQTGELVTGQKNKRPITMVQWGAIIGEGRRPKYILCTAYGQEVTINTLAYDMRHMNYALSAEGCGMPTSGLVRDYHCSIVAEGGTYLVAGTSVGDLVVFNTETKVFRASVPVSSNGILSIVQCPNTGAVYCGAGDGMIKKLTGFDQNWHQEMEVKVMGKVVALAMSADGAELMAGTSAGRLYRVLTEDLSVSEFSQSHVAAVNDVAFGDRSDVFATISSDGSVSVWDLSDYRVLAKASESVVGSVITFLDEFSVITGWEDGAIRVYDVATGRKTWEIAQAHRGKCTAIAASENCVCSGGDDGSVRVWSSATHELLCQFGEHTKEVTQVLFDNTKPWLVHSCGVDRAVFTYNLKTERRDVAHQMRDGIFNAMSQRQDSEQELVTAGYDGYLLFWDCDVREPVQAMLDPNRMKLNAIKTSPSGQFFAVCGDDHQVKLFDVVSEKLLAVGHGHSGAVNSLHWSPDERQVVSVGNECCICVWNFYGA